MPYTYDARSDRYRNTESGRFVTRTDALAYVNQSLDAGKDVVSQFAEFVVDGDISADDWGERVWDEIKQEHIRQYLLGRGGLGSMTQADWGSAGGTLSEQRRYFNGFYAEVAAGALSAAVIAARSRMYVNAAREAYNRGHTRAARGGGKTRVKWNLGNTEEHCSDCIDLSGRGWMPIEELPTVPGAGQTKCLSNCDCNLTFE